MAEAVFAAAELDLASALARGPRTAQQLATRLKLDADPLRRLLRALSSAGVFEQRYDGRFALTDLSRQLVARAPGSLRPLLRDGGASWRQERWAGLVALVRGRQPPAPRALDPEEGAALDAGRVALAGRLAAAALDAYDLGFAKVLVEVGDGGPAPGTFLAAARARYPEVRAVVADLSAGGAVPPEGDAYVLVNVLRDRDDARAGEIVRACRRAMGPAGRLLAVEMVLPEIAAVPHLGLMQDVERMALFGGARERSERDHRAIFEREGLRLSRVVPTATSSAVIEAVPAAAQAPRRRSARRAQRQRV